MACFRKGGPGIWLWRKMKINRDRDQVSPVSAGFRQRPRGMKERECLEKSKWRVLEVDVVGRNEIERLVGTQPRVRSETWSLTWVLHNLSAMPRGSQGLGDSTGRNVLSSLYFLITDIILLLLLLLIFKMNNIWNVSPALEFLMEVDAEGKPLLITSITLEYCRRKNILCIHTHIWSLAYTHIHIAHPGMRGAVDWGLLMEDLVLWEHLSSEAVHMWGEHT